MKALYHFMVLLYTDFIIFFAPTLFIKTKNMKKQILTVMSAILALTVTAQTSKGDKMVGASLVYGYYSNNDNTTSYSNTATVYNSKTNSFYISLAPNVAWFLADNLAVGGVLGLNYSHSKTKSSNTGSPATSESTSSYPGISIGPMVRYYFGNSDKAKPFVQVDGSIGFYPYKTTSSSSGGSSSETTGKPKGTYNAGLSFGYEQFVSDHVGLYISLGVNYMSDKITYDYKPTPGTGYSYTITNKKILVPINVGFQFHLPGKDKGMKKK